MYLNGILYFKINISLRFRFQALLHFIKLIWYSNKDLVLRQIYNLPPNNLRMKPLCNTLHNQNNIKIFYNWCTLYMSLCDHISPYILLSIYTLHACRFVLSVCYYNIACPTNIFMCFHTLCSRQYVYVFYWQDRYKLTDQVQLIITVHLQDHFLNPV